MCARWARASVPMSVPDAGGAALEVECISLLQREPGCHDAVEKIAKASIFIGAITKQRDRECMSRQVRIWSYPFAGRGVVCG